MHKESIGIDSKTLCSHCGDICTSDSISIKEHTFCCQGCKTVYQIIHENGLEDYYKYAETPGIKEEGLGLTYEYLDNANLLDRLLSFREGGMARISLHLPQIHCSACLYLLENLARFHKGIVKSRVNFQSKTANITFDESEVSLREVVEVLHKIGYPPRLQLDQLEQENKGPIQDKTLLYKLGLAGFSFGNIMLLSFPEYLGFDKASYLFHIGYINIILATPLLFYSGVDYLKSAWKGIKLRDANIDLPIALGMLTLYGRSLYEILGHHGEGYLDSFAGFIFFLLVGRWFQNYTYNALDFERSYTSYFPMHATIRKANQWITQAIDTIQSGDILKVRNQEIIPADSILKKGKARLDYSFVTGESRLISKKIGDELFAGGKHQGESIEIEVKKSVDQSYLTQLWKEDSFKERVASSSSILISKISKHFTWIILVIATATLGFWALSDPSKMFMAFTAVLIVACPCALALAIPFTYGNLLRNLSNQGLFLRNVDTIQDIQDISHIVFDKTGTITNNSQVEVSYQGIPLSNDQKLAVQSLCSHSSHPLSKAIVEYLKEDIVDVDLYQEHVGEGLSGNVMGMQLRIGSSSYIFGLKKSTHESGVFIEIDQDYLGYFEFKHAFRDNLDEIINRLSQEYTLSLLSGDNNQSQKDLEQVFGTHVPFYFNQSPKDKLEYIKNLQKAGHRVMMIGDGLNDAGALKQSNVGLAISDKVNNFSPACDGILDAKEFENLYLYFQKIKQARWIIYGAFGLAFLYNAIGLYFAMTGQLSPVIAAILMPLSSISVIVYGVLASYLISKK